MMFIDCDDCDQLRDYSKRFQKTAKGKKTICPEEKACQTADSVSAMDSTVKENILVEELKCIKL